jgi:hypothetical protein
MRRRIERWQVTFVSHLESAMGWHAPTAVGAVHDGRPQWVRHDLDAACSPVDRASGTSDPRYIRIDRSTSSRSADSRAAKMAERSSNRWISRRCWRPMLDGHHGSHGSAPRVIRSRERWNMSGEDGEAVLDDDQTTFLMRGSVATHRIVPHENGKEHPLVPVLNVEGQHRVGLPGGRKTDVTRDERVWNKASWYGRSKATSQHSKG